MTRKKTLQVGSALVALLVLLSACSGGRGGGGGDTGSKGSSASSSKFGTLDSPCGKKGDEDNPSTEMGVTSTEIKIGYGDDSDNTVTPGLNKDIGDAVAAMIDWCNEQGGINGRKIVGERLNGKLFEAPAAIQKACDARLFFLVGNGFAGQEGGEGKRISCRLPQVAAFGANADVTNAPLSYQGVPFPADYLNVGGIKLAKKQFPDKFAGNKVGVMDTEIPAVRSVNTKVSEAMKAMGLESTNCGVTNKALGGDPGLPLAQKYKECGVQMMYNGVSQNPGLYDVFKGFQQVGYKPLMVMDGNWYNPQIAQANTGFMNEMLVQTSFKSLDGNDPAVKTYRAALDKKKGQPGLLGMQATSSFLLWANAAKQCGANLTKQCVINNLAKTHEWTAGGLHEKSDPGNNMPSKCSRLVKFDGQSYKPVVPAEDDKFECSDDFVVKVSQSAWGTTLDENRWSTKNQVPGMLKPEP